jgi:carbon-monoxide dehydrogenase medium subunit
MSLQIHEPRSVADAVALLDELGDDARAYAGGTALLLGPRAELRHLVDLKGIPALRGVHVDGGELVIGAAVSLRALMGHPLVQRVVPALAGLPGRIANARVVTAATLGGNVRLAHPRTDPPTLLAALDARVRCADPAGERELAVEDLWAGSSPLAPGELITGISIPVPDPSATVATARFNPRGWPTANVAVAIRADGSARVAVAASGAPPARWRAAERALGQQPLDDDDPQLPPPDVDPIDDEHGSAEYKRHLVRVLAVRAARAATRDLLGRGVG